MTTSVDTTYGSWPSTTQPFIDKYGLVTDASTNKSYGVVTDPATAPTSLFINGEQGVWYDPSDFSTMFQDSAGTTPVTAVEQPVGKILDKSGRGNHASQATTTKRPVLSARVNLLTKSEDLSDVVWVKRSNCVVTPNQGPAGYTDLDRVVNTVTSGNAAGVYNLNTGLAAANANITLSATLATLVGTAGVYLKISATGGGTTNIQSIVTATTTPTVFSITGILGSGAIGNVFVEISPNVVNSPFLAGRVSLVQTNQASLPYQWVDTATSYNTTGFPHYLKFDGVDDALATSAINFTATDKMTVFAGLRKLSDAARGMVVELSATTASNNGSFALTAPNSVAGNYAFESKGTVLTDAIAATYTSPITSVVTGIGSIAADSNIIRVNGAQIDSDAGDQGTGNFGNYPLYVGSRGGTSVPFSGHIYSLIVRGAESAATQIVSVETYVNGKTLAYLST